MRDALTLTAAREERPLKKAVKPVIRAMSVNVGNTVVNSHRVGEEGGE
jgi:hypothetical protein